MTATVPAQTPTDSQTTQSTAPVTTGGTAPPVTETPAVTPAEPEKQDATPAGERPATPRGMLDESPKPADAKPATVPDKYEFKLKSGQAPTIDLKGYEKVARDLGLPQDAANSVLDTLNDAMALRRDAAVKGWADAMAADKELGGEKLTATFTAAKAALDEFGSSELVDLLRVTGLQHNPHVVKFLHRVQLKVGGDKIVAGGPSPKSKPNPLRQVYVNSPEMKY
jgi:hypothetical protein